MHAERHTHILHRQKETQKKKKGPQQVRGDIKPLPVGGRGWMRRARNSTGIKHIQLRNNTHTPKKSEKKRLVESSNAWKGKGKGRAVSLPHSEILTLPLFPVWSPKSFFVCRTTFFARDEQKSRNNKASKKSSSSRLQPCSHTVSHTTDNSMSHRRLGTHTLSLSASLLWCIYSWDPTSKNCQCLFLMRFIYLKARLSDAYRSIP